MRGAAGLFTDIGSGEATATARCRDPKGAGPHEGVDHEIASPAALADEDLANLDGLFGRIGERADQRSEWAARQLALTGSSASTSKTRSKIASTPAKSNFSRFDRPDFTSPSISSKRFCISTLPTTWP
jgi:hypothetical protein